MANRCVSFHSHPAHSELDNNKLTNVSKDWLYNLTSLHTLSLSNNSISYVEVDSWDFVPGLSTL